jgi:hypothetical protein
MLPYMQRVASGLLLIAGSYLTYYWARVIWSSPKSLGSDPLVGAMTRFATLVQRAAGSSGGRVAVLIAGGLVAIGIGVATWQWSGQEPPDSVPE